MAGNPDEWTEVIDPHAFDGKLPASLPVRGLDGEIVEGAMAEVTAGAKGLSVSVTMPGSKITGNIPL